MLLAFPTNTDKDEAAEFKFVAEQTKAKIIDISSDAIHRHSEPSLHSMPTFFPYGEMSSHQSTEFTLPPLFPDKTLLLTDEEAFRAESLGEFEFTYQCLETMSQL